MRNAKSLLYLAHEVASRNKWFRAYIHTYIHTYIQMWDERETYFMDAPRALLLLFAISEQRFQHAAICNVVFVCQHDVSKHEWHSVFARTLVVNLVQTLYLQYISVTGD